MRPPLACMARLLALLLAGAALLLGSGAGPDHGLVVWVADGDTIHLADGRKVRYIGVDAPEIAHRDSPAEPFGNAARQANQRLVLGKEVRLSLGRERTDHYGRILAHVHLPGGTLANEQMLRLGMAWLLTTPPNTLHSREFLAAQRAAMDSGTGIWSQWTPPPLPLVGNSRTHRFHLPRCPMARKIKPANRVPFPSLREAFYSGQAPCKQCLSGWRSLGPSQSK